MSLSRQWSPSRRERGPSAALRQPSHQAGIARSCQQPASGQVFSTFKMSPVRHHRCVSFTPNYHHQSAISATQLSVSPLSCLDYSPRLLFFSAGTARASSEAVLVDSSLLGRDPCKEQMRLFLSSPHAVFCFEPVLANDRRLLVEESRIGGKGGSCFTPAIVRL